MPTLPKAVCFILFLATAVAGCTRAPAPDDMTNPAGGSETAAAAAEAATAPIAEFGETLLWADPLPTCEEQQITTVHWSEEAVAKGPASIELGDNNPGVFARIGEAGEKVTGPWASPGGVVVLRGDDGQARARLLFKGPEDCGVK